MNQSNKEYLKLLFLSGVHTFQKEVSNNFLNYSNKNKKVGSLEEKNLSEISNIEALIPVIAKHNSILKKTAKKLVVFDGNISSKLMIVGEAPGKDEDEQGKPFVGKAGQLLNKMLTAIKITREDTYITNVVPWRPPNNRTPTDKEIMEFLPFLQKQIEIIKPSHIYVLGLTAAKAILSTHLSLAKLRGKLHNYNFNESIKVIVSYHPAFLLRSPQHKKEAWNDLQMLQKELNEN